MIEAQRGTARHERADVVFLAEPELHHQPPFGPQPRDGRFEHAFDVAQARVPPNSATSGSCRTSRDRAALSPSLTYGGFAVIRSNMAVDAIEVGRLQQLEA